MENKTKAELLNQLQGKKRQFTPSRGRYPRKERGGYLQERNKRNWMGLYPSATLTDFSQKEGKPKGTELSLFP